MATELLIALFVTVAVAPGLFWLWLFVRFDRYRPGPKRLIAQVFIAGAISTVPAGAISGVVLWNVELDGTTSLPALAMAMLLVVGPVEELSKLLAVRFTAYRSLYFDEPLDGLIYGAAASLGFATLENILYVMTFGAEVMLLRAPLSTLAHVVFGSVWSLGLIEAKVGGHGRRWVLPSLAGAAALHGGFNLAVFAFPPAGVLVVAMGGALLYRHFIRLQHRSPFRTRRNYPLVECEVCESPIRVSSRFCRHCGAPQHGVPQALICGNCGHTNGFNALYCTACGDQLLHEMPNT